MGSLRVALDRHRSRREHTGKVSVGYDRMSGDNT